MMHDALLFFRAKIANYSKHPTWAEFYRETAHASVPEFIPYANLGFFLDKWM